MAQKRILLFDDDYERMEPLMHFLVQHGYQVDLTAEQKVLSRLAETRYDLVCIDFMIHPSTPDSNDEIVHNVQYSDISWQEAGREFLARLRKGEYEAADGSGTPRSVPVIVLSATVSQDENLRAEYVLEKPFDLMELYARISELTG